MCSHQHPEFDYDAMDEEDVEGEGFEAGEPSEADLEKLLLENLSEEEGEEEGGEVEGTIPATKKRKM